jgi:hypothetical protein
MTSLLNFIKIYQLVQKLLGRDTRTDGQTGDLISLTFFFKGSTLMTGFESKKVSTGFAMCHRLFMVRLTGLLSFPMAVHFSVNLGRLF